VTLSLVAAVAMPAALLVLIAAVLFEELGFPDCAACGEPSRHPAHFACGYRKCPGGHHEYKPRRQASNLALYGVALVIVAALAIAALGL
jgi:hypothetical protein